MAIGIVISPMTWASTSEGLAPPNIAEDTPPKMMLMWIHLRKVLSFAKLVLGSILIGTILGRALLLSLSFLNTPSRPPKDFDGGGSSSTPPSMRSVFE